jgi:small subunit ribosomal protein S6
MNKYELIVIINAQMPLEQKETVSKQAVDAVVKGGGKVVNNQVWLEKHRLAFKIKKCLEGTYYLIKFEALGKAIEKIKEVLRLNEDILRFLIVRVEG